MKLPICLLLLALIVTDVDAMEWVNLQAPGPSPRHTPAAVYDPEGERIVLMGGRGAGGDLNDVWAFDLQTSSWQQLQPAGQAPRPRFSHNAVYDAPNRRMLIWSGRALDATGSTLLNDVWALDLQSPRWQRLDPVTEAPTARYGTAAVFDPVAGALVTFAGFTTQGRFDDTWRFDPAQRRWQDVTVASPQPGERCLHAAAYDARRRRMIMFGGQRGSAALDDAWALDLATDRWSPLAPAPATGGRKFPAVTYDSATDRFLLFGGEATDGTRGGDLWALSLADDEWSLLADTDLSSGPAGRDGAVLVYVPTQARLILFGGTTPAGNTGDTWSMQLPQATTVVGTETDDDASLGLRAWPNPFNAAVVLEGPQLQGGQLVIHDVLGRRIRTISSTLGSTRRVWDGRDDAGRPVASGVYLAILQSSENLDRHVRRLVLLR